jgi:poly-beta-1,6-N-acetyl-D-glucosamine synthase
VNADGTQRLLLISPVRNEAANIERTARAVAAQTRPPDEWLVADDGSDDGTADILRGLGAEIPFMRVLQCPPAPRSRDRLATAAEARAFNLALAAAGMRDFSHVGKLDGDIELPPDYFERLLAAFASEPRLGVAGGVLLEPTRRGWRPARIPSYHVRGALKLYSRECFDAIGGVQERLGWDTIDETYARMRGYATYSLPELVARHHRPVGTADGALRGRARHGRCAYILRYGPGWVALRSLKVAASRPPVVSGAAFLYGYLRAAMRREPRVEDEAFRTFVRGELRARLRPLGSAPPGPRSAESSGFG